MDNRILFIFTGGTIDSRFEPTKDTVVPKEKPAVSDYIEKLQLHDSFEFVTVCMKDSRALTDKDRADILSAIEKSNCKKVIITHGTYTMVQTAMYLKKNLKNNGKAIVLTGSMIPLEGFAGSDGPFNVGYALASIQNLKSGIYIAMNGKVFEPEKVKKNVGEGRFEEA